ncbi:hypothetical protein HDU76_010285, partial [Blyttiomyces sp. JEL0837]
HAHLYQPRAYMSLYTERVSQEVEIEDQENTDLIEPKRIIGEAIGRVVNKHAWFDAIVGCNCIRFPARRAREIGLWELFVQFQPHAGIIENGMMECSKSLISMGSDREAAIMEHDGRIWDEFNIRTVNPNPGESGDHAPKDVLQWLDDFLDNGCRVKDFCYHMYKENQQIQNRLRNDHISLESLKRDQHLKELSSLRKMARSVIEKQQTVRQIYQDMNWEEVSVDELISLKNDLVNIMEPLFSCFHMDTGYFMSCVDAIEDDIRRTEKRKFIPTPKSIEPIAIVLKAAKLGLMGPPRSRYPDTITQ